MRFATLGQVSKKKNNEITKTGRAIVILFLGIRLHAIVVNISYFLIVQACYDWNSKSLVLTSIFVIYDRIVSLRKAIGDPGA